MGGGSQQGNQQEVDSGSDTETGQGVQENTQTVGGGTDPFLQAERCYQIFKNAAREKLIKNTQNDGLPGPQCPVKGTGKCVVKGLAKCLVKSLAKAKASCKCPCTHDIHGCERKTRDRGSAVQAWSNSEKSPCACILAFENSQMAIAYFHLVWPKCFDSGEFSKCFHCVSVTLP